MTQRKRVLEYLEIDRTISFIDASRDLETTRLSARISELKRNGHPIIEKTIKVPNGYAEVCSAAKY